MDAGPPPFGVAASPTLARPAPLPPAPPAPVVTESTVWPRSAQAAAAALVSLTLGLIAWHAYLGHRWACRPTTLTPDALRASRLDLNAAGHAELVQLPGVGDARARRIVTHRDAHGPFRSVDELREVPGVGPALLEQLRPLVAVRPADEKPLVSAARGAAPPPGTKKPPPAGRIDVNNAPEEELRRLPGIGPTLSARIVAARPFRAAEDLRRVKGIGPKTLEKLRPHVSFGPPPAGGR